MGGAETDKALASLGQIRTQHKVLLSAGAADLLGARRLTVHLPVQVHIHRVVDGDKVVDGRDGADVVGVADGRGHARRVVVQIVVQLLGTGGKGEHLPAPVDVLLHARDLPRHRQIHIGVHVHLRVYAQILQVGLAQHGAHGIGHTADAQLQTGPVGYLLHDQLRHRPVHLRSRAAGLDAHGVVAPLHDHVHLADVDTVVKAAQAPGHILVDLHDDHLGHLAHRLHMRSRQSEVEVPVLVHRGHLEHGHVRRRDVVVVVPGQLGVPHGLMEPGAAGDMMALHAAHVVRVEDDMVHRILDVEDRRLPQANTAPDLHILQFRCTAGQRLVQHPGMNCAEAVIHPITGLDDLHRLVRGGQFLLVQRLKISKSHVLFLPVLSCSFR